MFWLVLFTSDHVFLSLHLRLGLTALSSCLYDCRSVRLSVYICPTAPPPPSPPALDWTTDGRHQPSRWQNGAEWSVQWWTDSRQARASLFRLTPRFIIFICNARFETRPRFIIFHTKSKHSFGSQGAPGCVADSRSVRQFQCLVAHSGEE